MAVTLGYGSLILTLVVALYGIGAALYSVRAKSSAWEESARIAMLLTFPLLSLAVIVLITLLVTGRYDVYYVYQVISNDMPLYLKITALWGGQEGSLLFWSWLLSGFAMIVTLRRWDRDREFLPWVIVTCLGTLVFFVAMTAFVNNPFSRVWFTASGEQILSVFQPEGTFAMPALYDGYGLNPLLRHPGMVFHPPMLYLGFVSFVIPFAFAIAALVTGRTDDRWLRITRRWTLAAWCFLSIGLLLGSRWAYDVLGWGGYWGWDAVENSSLIPWLSGTAFLHSAVVQERRGLFKRWNFFLIILTYSLVILSTFLTRSGLLSSVHAFSDSGIGPAFFVFISVSFLASFGLLIWRWSALRSDEQMTSLLSREAMFLLNNLLFMGIVAVLLTGILYPIVSKALLDTEVTVGPPYYERATGPLFLAILILMGIAPLSAWGYSSVKTLGRNLWKPLLVSLFIPLAAWIFDVRSAVALLALWGAGATACITLYDYARSALLRHRSTGENLLQALWKLAGINRRRYGGYIIHLGIVLMSLGIIGIELFQTETQQNIQLGDSVTLDGYTLTYTDLRQFDIEDGRSILRATLTLSRNGELLGELHPRQEYYYNIQQTVTIPGVRSTLEDDVYVVLAYWEPITPGEATFKMYHNPMIAWLWLGGIVLILGTLVAVLPPSTRKAENG